MKSKKHYLIAGLIAVLIVVAFFMSVEYAYTGSTSFNESIIGESASTISGYTVSDIDYVTSDTYPAALNTVILTIDHDAGWVKISIDAFAPHTFYRCSDMGRNSWSCDTSASGMGSVQNARNLIVVAGN